MSNTGPTTAEFRLIDQLRVLQRPEPGLVCGMGDDAAALQVAEGHLLVAATDTLVQGVHFPADTDPGDLGWKALAVNLSDLGAMAATPRWTLLSLTLPQADERWLAQFIDGWRALADAAGVSLIGGDTTRGPLSVTVQALGEVPADRLLRRSGGRPGDAIAVTGSLGGAALALKRLNDGWPVVPELLERLNRPQPRLAAGQRLGGLASAAIDLSDGLASDLQHLVTASGVGAEVDLDRLPIDPHLADQPDRVALATGGGDDYELCFTYAPRHHDALAAQLRDAGVAWQTIGELTDGANIAWQGAGADQVRSGFAHFAEGA